MLPRFLKPLSRHFRERRNRRLVALIEALAAGLDRPVEVLDVGGAVFFWTTIPEPVRRRCHIRLLNLPGAYDWLPPEEEALKQEFELLVGDARELGRFADQSMDLVVSNSVIEHVGAWPDMERAGAEVRRVGRRGWVQVPAFEFPIEQHWLRPFVHWLADPIQIAILGRIHGHMRGKTRAQRLMEVHHMRPLTRGQLQTLMGNASLQTERLLLLPKSHIATW
jgi:hypothetical protein